LAKLSIFLKNNCLTISQDAQYTYYTNKIYVAVSIIKCRLRFALGSGLRSPQEGRPTLQ